METKLNIISEFLKCLSITIISMLLLNFTVVIFAIIFNNLGDNAIILSTDLAMIVSLIVFPLVIHAKFLGDLRFYHITWKKIVDFNVIIIFFILLCKFFPTIYVLHFLAVSISEETFSREIQFKYLYERIGKINAIIITSIIFAFILHLNEKFIENLIIRLPLGLALCIIRNKLGLLKSILGHWFYNLIIIFVV